MTNRGRPTGTTGKNGPQPGSRRWAMDRLKVGDHVVFVGNPGETVHKMMASIASNYRGGESIGQQGLTQSGGLAVFESELSRPLVKVTRLAEPSEVKECGV